MHYLPLARSFFLDPPDQVAQALLGKLIVRRTAGGLLVGRIVETEAYFSQDDPAAHAFSGRTRRTEVLFGPPGHGYVYFVYGMHHCLNVSCEPAGQAGCVLLRALEPVAGLETMRRLRCLPALQVSEPILADTKPRTVSSAQLRLLASGPGRLCQALGITRLDHNGIDVTSADSELFFAGDSYVPPRIVAGPRIGIRKAMDRAARFYVEGNACVSGR